MDHNSALRALFQPILPYQTRLVRLHGDRGAANSVLACDLLVAYTLPLEHVGLGIRSPIEGQDYFAEYEALSYTWGSARKSKSVTCNGVILPITKNLFEALLALRPSGEGTRYIWVDAICINQNDDREKGFQIPNMLHIFRTAVRVIAWLGSPPPNLEQLLSYSKSIDDQLTSKESWVDIVNVISTLIDLYRRSWFQRIWVQQEVFAARELIFRCGTTEFYWRGLLSSPESLRKLPQITKYGSSDTIETADGLRKAQALLNGILLIERYHKHRLRPFEEFYSSYTKLADRETRNSRIYKRFAEGPDFADTLINTGQLQATDPRDYIYGILAMTRFERKAASFSQWISTRDTELFIPIDYAVDMRALLCSVTWNLLIKEGGLLYLAMYKVLNVNVNVDVGENEQQSTLPSWVIDWRLSSRMMKASHSLDREFLPYRLEFSTPGLRWPESVIELDQFRKINKDLAATRFPYDRLSVRGAIEPAFFFKGREICIEVWPFRNPNDYYSPSSRQRKPRLDVLWALQFDPKPDDIIVHLLPSQVRFRLMVHQYHSVNVGWWVLRPCGTNGEFKVLACLLRGTLNSLDWLQRWELGDTGSEGGLAAGQYRALAVDYCGPAAVDTVHKDSHHSACPEPHRDFILC